jgi:hypothetical protein
MKVTFHSSYQPTAEIFCAFNLIQMTMNNETKQTPWYESVSELYRLSDHHLSAKVLSTFADRRCCVGSTMDPYGRILGFLDQSRYYFFQVDTRLYS